MFVDCFLNLENVETIALQGIRAPRSWACPPGRIRLNLQKPK
jgi:hypothetical protein